MTANPAATGPFPDRPPLRTWQAAGFHCALVPAPFDGAINGYVQARGLRREMTDQVEVHGRVSYGPDENGWVGFNTLHSGDLWPGSPFETQRRELPWARHWDEDSVTAETERMAREIKRVMEL